MLLCGGAESTRGSWKVTHFVIFLRPQGVGDDGTLRSSVWEDMARLGILNSKSPCLSEVAYERRI